MSQIFLEGLEFYAYHGCFREEQVIGTWFNVDVVMWGDFEKAALTDDLDATVNYLSVYRTLKNEMEIPTKLLETVVVRMIDAVLKSYPMVDKIEVKLSKMNPPLGGKLRSVSVKMEKSRL